MPRIALISVFLLLVVSLLGACGQKGDLYLPVEELNQQRDRSAQSPDEP